MNANEYAAHRRSAMRNADKMAECLRAHGVEEIPAKKVEQIALHDSLCKADADAPQADAKPEPKADEKPATPPRRRTRKPAAAQPETKPEPTQPKPSLDDITVPYAPLSKQGRNTVATCPECGRTFVEKFDRSGEQTTGNYAQHYATEHKTAKPEPAKRGRKPAAAKPAAKADEPAQPTRRGRKAAAPKPEPTKPAARGRKPAAPKPEPKAESNGASPREHKQTLARKLADLAAAEFGSYPEADRALIAYWLHSLPTGTPEGADAGPWNRYFPASLPRPLTQDWRKPAAK